MVGVRNDFLKIEGTLGWRCFLEKMEISYPKFKFLRNRKKLDLKYTEKLKKFYQSLSQMVLNDIVFKKKANL